MTARKPKSPPVPVHPTYKDRQAILIGDDILFHPTDWKRRGLPGADRKKTYRAFVEGIRPTTPPTSEQFVPDGDMSVLVRYSKDPDDKRLVAVRVCHIIRMVTAEDIATLDALQAAKAS